MHHFYNYTLIKLWVKILVKNKRNKSKLKIKFYKLKRQE